MIKLIVSITACLCFACNFEEPRRNGEEKTYQIFCEDKREKEGFKIYNVKYSSWRRPNMYNSAMWSFTDINGIYIRTTFPCITDNIQRKINK